MIRTFAQHFRVDMSEALEPDLRAYEHFNAFFTRALRPGARSYPACPDLLASPIDGFVSQIGYLDGDSLLQVKGRSYTLSALLGGDRALANTFHDGAYVALYLSPRNYHRIHMPLDGVLREMIYVPGALFSVNPSATRVVDNLFARNERVICLFDTDAGPLALIMVGAIFVGSMETVWSGMVTPRKGRQLERWDYRTQPRTLRRGEEIGRFNMGSTLILLLAENRVRWESRWQPEAELQVGLPLATVLSGAAGAEIRSDR